MGTGKGTFLLLAREKTNGKLSINPIFFSFSRERILPYLAALRSNTNLLPLAKIGYSRSNGTKGNFKPWEYLPLNSVLQALLSVTCFSEGLAGLQHNRKKCTSSSTGLENVFNVKKIPAGKQH